MHGNILHLIYLIWFWFDFVLCWVELRIPYVLCCIIFLIKHCNQSLLFWGGIFENSRGAKIIIAPFCTENIQSMQKCRKESVLHELGTRIFVSWLTYDTTFFLMTQRCSIAQESRSSYCTKYCMIWLLRPVSGKQYSKGKIWKILQQYIHIHNIT